MMDGDRFRKHLKLQLDDNPKIKGLDAFKRSLEKEYFATVSIRNCHATSTDQITENQCNLVIDLECNFTLVEVLFHLEKGSWGRAAMAAAARQPDSAFQKAFTLLSGMNSIPVDVEEVSFLLKDTAIVIKKICSNSICGQLGKILKTLDAHYVYFTRELTETPYEIYLPVFEEEIPSSNTLVYNIKRDLNSAKDYFRYWALYFDSQEDAQIYDLQHKTIISGDLHMLNH